MAFRDHNRLHSELVALLEMQIETLEKETFVELTEKEFVNSRTGIDAFVSCRENCSHRKQRHEFCEKATGGLRIKSWCRTCANGSSNLATGTTTGYDVWG